MNDLHKQPQELREQDLRKRVKIQENILKLHFKELFRDYKPNILR